MSDLASGLGTGSGSGAGRGQPLSGRLVLDVGSALAGPVCATLLGEFGADVIKVERPRHGDALRTYGPAIDGVPAWWMIEARNKRSITLDLRKPTGQVLARELMRRSDVLVENFRPGTMESWGLGYADAQLANPGLVYVSVSGFGQDGPYRDRPAYDRVAQAMSGFTYLNGYPDRPPVRPGIGITDYSTAIFAALGAMFALYERDAQGSERGQRVEVALYESLLRMFHYHLPVYERTGKIPERAGNLGEAMVPAESFQGSDGAWLTLAVGSERTFAALAAAMKQPELITDERFVGNEQRGRHHEQIHALVRAWVATMSTDQALEALRAAGVPAGPVYTTAQVHSDEHFRYRGSVTVAHDAALGDISMQGVVPTLSETPGRIESTGPTLGQHNEEIYCGLLGLSQHELATHIADGVI